VIPIETSKTHRKEFSYLDLFFDPWPELSVYSQPLKCQASPQAADTQELPQKKRFNLKV